jgi:hypothetical protein
VLLEWLHRARAVAGKRKAYLPPSPRVSDIYVTSYPRSGNTWVRFLLANYLTRQACDFETVHRLIPDLYVTPESCSQLATPRFLKSHEQYVPEYRRVIYIARDGRDVAVSYYFYCRQTGMIPERMPFEDYLRLFNRGEVGSYGSWSAHVVTWLDDLEPSGRLLFVRYRDLKVDAAKQLQRILEFSGLEIDVQAIQHAVRDAGFERMQRQERVMRKKRAQDCPDTQKVTAVRKGKEGQWRKFFTEEQLRRFHQLHGEAMARVG